MEGLISLIIVVVLIVTITVVAGVCLKKRLYLNSGYVPIH